MDMCISRFDIYQIPVAPNCFKRHTNSLCSNFFQKKEVLSDVQAEIHLFRRNIISTGHLVWAEKKLYSGVIWGYTGNV